MAGALDTVGTQPLRIGLTRERLEAAYAYQLGYPLLGLTVLRRGDDSNW